MKKAKIYIPSKTATQSGLGKEDVWILEFETKDTTINPLMGWESSSDTLGEIKMEFSTKEKAIEYAKNNGIIYINIKILFRVKIVFFYHSYTDYFFKCRRKSCRS